LLGNRLKEKRLQMKYTQAEMARKLGISYQYYSKLERNQEVPSVKKLTEIAHELGCSVDFLLSSGEPKPIVKNTVGKYLKETYKGWVCTAKYCKWRDRNGYCLSGAGCLKEWEEQRGVSTHNG